MGWDVCWPVQNRSSPCHEIESPSANRSKGFLTYFRKRSSNCIRSLGKRNHKSLYLDDFDSLSLRSSLTASSSFSPRKSRWRITPLASRT